MPGGSFVDQSGRSLVRPNGNIGFFTGSGVKYRCAGLRYSATEVAADYRRAGQTVTIPDGANDYFDAYEMQIISTERQDQSQ
jgi:hypothetical protein